MTSLAQGPFIPYLASLTVGGSGDVFINGLLTFSSVLSPSIALSLLPFFRPHLGFLYSSSSILSSPPALPPLSPFLLINPVFVLPPAAVKSFIKHLN